jgi:ATPase subunit of ABC transporter with duplicated ATPase domains
MISLSEISMGFGQDTLFEGVTMQFNNNCRYGIIGANGSGKSTLLKMISGEVAASDGEISIPNRTHVGILKQDHFKYEDYSVIETVLSGTKNLFECFKERQDLYAKGEGLTDEDGIRLGDLENTFAELDGYALEAHAGELLGGLGIPTDKHYEGMHALSGGYKLRVLLAQLLFSKPDIMLLDEPTNHLDLESIQWLEQFLTSYKGMILIVSHDRHFLNTVCTHIVDVDFGTVTTYKGDYNNWCEASRLARQQVEDLNEKQEKRKEQLEGFVAKFKANASKSKQAQSRQKMINKIEFIQVRPSSRVSPKIKFTPDRRLGRTVVTAIDINKAYEEKVVLKDVSFEISGGDKVAIVGANGIGKSTLIKILMGKITADTGEYDWGETVTTSYFAQDAHEQISAGSTVYDWLHDKYSTHTIGSIRGILGRLLFSGDEAKKSLNVLSGGEATRLIFADVMMQKRNTLILDEPTNHLDLESIEALNRALIEFEGSLLFVSHDRDFVSSVANRIIELRVDGFTDFRGSYQEFLEREGTDHLDRN